MKKYSLVIVFIALLMAPVLVQFQHMLAAHEHPTCEIADHHLHNADIDCAYPDYTLIQGFVFADFGAAITPVINLTLGNVCYSAPLLQPLHTSSQSQRGPPQFL